MKASQSVQNVLSVLVASTLMLTGCEKPLSTEEKKQKASESIGMIASVTASLLVSAARSCQVVGVLDIDQCAKIQGSLLAEQSAQAEANLAVKQRLGYWKECQSEFSAEYCGQLIKRALAIEIRRPMVPSE